MNTGGESENSHRLAVYVMKIFAYPSQCRLQEPPRSGFLQGWFSCWSGWSLDSSIDSLIYNILPHYNRLFHYKWWVCHFSNGLVAVHKKPSFMVTTRLFTATRWFVKLYVCHHIHHCVYIRPIHTRSMPA